MSFILDLVENAIPELSSKVRLPSALKWYVSMKGKLEETEDSAVSSDILQDIHIIVTLNTYVNPGNIMYYIIQG